jgi:hypothetical protein
MESKPQPPSLVDIWKITFAKTREALDSQNPEAGVNLAPGDRVSPGATLIRAAGLRKDEGKPREVQP